MTASRAILATILLGLVGLGGYLGLKGSDISAQTSPAGQTLPATPIQRCINMGNALEAPVEGEWGYTIRPRDFSTIRNAGFDTVRVPIKWSAHASPRPPYRIDEAFFQRIDQVIEDALARNLQVIINVHHYDEIMENAEAHLPRLRALWQQISDRYAGYPDALMFEFLNEPYGDMTIARTDAMNRELLAMVRERHPRRWVILGGANWGNLDGLVPTKPPYDPRAMVTYHSYEPFAFTHQGAFWADPVPPMGVDWGSTSDRRNVTREVRRAARFRDRVGMPLLLGEFGVFQEVPLVDRIAWTRHMRKQAEIEGFGWCVWDFAGAFPLYDLDREDWIRPLLSAVID